MGMPFAFGRHGPAVAARSLSIPLHSCDARAHGFGPSNAVTPPDATAHALQLLLMWLVLPVWLVSGVADWYCHKVDRVEHSAGLPESLLHLAMLAELGLAVLAAAALQVNAAVLTLLFVLCVLHELTKLTDLAYAQRHRTIGVPEQWVHGIQQASPWISLLMLAAIHHGQALAVTGLGAEIADWGWRLKDPPLPLTAWGLIVAGGSVLLACFVEEAWRSRRTAAPAARSLP